jgi:hypothetical protein
MRDCPNDSPSLLFPTVLERNLNLANQKTFKRRKEAFVSPKEDTDRISRYCRRDAVLCHRVGGL